MGLIQYAAGFLTLGVDPDIDQELGEDPSLSLIHISIYDMAKAIDRWMVIAEVCLVEKSGGKSGHVKRSDIG